MIRSLLLLLAAEVALGYKPNDFRLCSDTSFCRRQRSLAQSSPPQFLYVLSQPPTLAADGLSATGQLSNPLLAPLDVSLTLHIRAYESGVFRLTIDEEKEKQIHQRYVAESALSPSIKAVAIAISPVSSDNSYVDITIPSHPSAPILRLRLTPSFSADLVFANEVVVSLNSNGWLRYERYRPAGSQDPMDNGIDTNGMWDESFNSHRDSKPFGPSSVGMDITHVGAKAVYGIPQRATSFALKDSFGSEPYRLYNLDVFEYDVHHPHQPLYGAVPLLLSNSLSASTGVLWLNPSETFIDIASVSTGKRAHWFSEAGVIDVFLMAGSNPKIVQQQYTTITGTVHLPPLFAIAYHQCRWNYNDERDVRGVDAQFDEHDIPYDVIWLDIEHTNGKRYFTWDSNKFPDSAGLQRDLARRGRKMVTIVDPHIKIDSGYSVYEEARRQGYYVKNRDGNDFEGHCWPGGSMWLDYLNPEVQQYWASRFEPHRYLGSTEHLYTWNDMNEPSVFNGPEITMPKDNKHFGNIEHREIHNYYGALMTRATVMGQQLARPGQPTFVLSRAFFAGSQRDVAIWTGDNEASWDSLRITTPMLLSLSVSGIVFCGADIGGFFRNPDPELLVRWYQMAVFQPFVRAHAHIDTNRREPWVFNPETTYRIRTAIRWRYALLPYVYSLYHHAHTAGIPVMRPLWMEFPKEEELFSIDDEFMLGEALIIKPASSAGQTSTSMVLPAGARWFNYFNGEEFHNTRPQLSTPIDTIAVAMRGGSAIVTRERARRSSHAMVNDPFTIKIAIDSANTAVGSVVVRSGEGKSITRHISFADNKVIGRSSESASIAVDADIGSSQTPVERIVIIGLSSAPNKVTSGGIELVFSFDSATKVLVIKKPLVNIGDDFQVALS